MGGPCVLVPVPEGGGGGATQVPELRSLLKPGAWMIREAGLLRARTSNGDVCAVAMAMPPGKFGSLGV